MKPSLSGKRILVTRPLAQAGRLMALIRAEGGEPVCFPLLEIGAFDDLRPLQRAAGQLRDYALVVFISPNAVAYGLPTLLGGGAWPDGVRAAAIGPGTVAALAGHGIGDVIVPVERFDSEALLQMPAFSGECVRGKRVLILRGDGGRELLADTLREREATVDCVSCYRRFAPTDASPVRGLLRDGQLDALTVSSSEGLRNLWALLDDDDRGRLRHLPCFVPHQRIAEQAAELGLTAVVLTAAADDGLLDGLSRFAWSGDSSGSR